MSVDPPSVLVVDDEASVADLYAAWLADDYAVTTATCGAGAVDALGGFDHGTAAAAFAGMTPTRAPVPDW